MYLALVLFSVESHGERLRAAENRLPLNPAGSVVVPRFDSHVADGGEKRHVGFATRRGKLAFLLLLFATTLAGVANSQDSTRPAPPAARTGSESAFPNLAPTELDPAEARTPRLLLATQDSFEPREGFQTDNPAETDGPAGITQKMVPGVVVPTVTEVHPGEARQLARLAGLPFVVGVYFVAAEKWRADIRPDRLYLQSLPAGRTVPAGTPLAAWRLVKADPHRRRLSMPSLLGLTRSEAMARLKPFGLPLLEPASGLPNHPLETESAIAGHTVIAQYPPVGRELFEGTGVLLVLAGEELPDKRPIAIPATAPPD